MKREQKQKRTNHAAVPYHTIPSLRKTMTKKEVKPSKSINHETVCPPQSGIFSPGFSTLPGSIRPHLSSHDLPGLLNMTFHGSSKASNLSHGHNISHTSITTYLSKNGREGDIPEIISPVSHTLANPIPHKRIHLINARHTPRCLCWTGRHISPAI